MTRSVVTFESLELEVGHYFQTGQLALSSVLFIFTQLLYKWL